MKNFNIFRPELVRPVQPGTSVIRISPNPRPWASTSSEQQSVILQNALTNPANQSTPDPEPAPIQSGRTPQTTRENATSNFHPFSGTLYCLVPQAHDKNLMIIKNESEKDKCNETAPQQSFHRQVSLLLNSVARKC